MKRVFITGANGFVGANSLSKLEGADFEIHALAHSSKQTDTASVTWHQANFLETDELRRLMRKIQPDYLLHLAWCCNKNNYWMSEENFEWTKASLILCKSFFENGGQRLLCTGSGAEYAQSDEALIEEAATTDSQSAYGSAKVALLNALQNLGPEVTSKTVWARLFFPYGPGERRTRVIPSVIRALLSDKRVECSDGKLIRDFIYIDDVTRMLVYLLDSERNGIYNIGTGEANSLRKILEVVGTKLNKLHLVEFGKLQTSEWDYPKIVANISKSKIPDGESVYVPVEQGIQLTIDYWKSKDASLKYD